jgi:hypothetical protein
MLPAAQEHVAETAKHTEEPMTFFMYDKTEKVLYRISYSQLFFPVPRMLIFHLGRGNCKALALDFSWKRSRLGSLKRT